MDIKLPKIVWVLGFILTIVLTSTSIAYFFNINLESYIGYLLWFCALGIFYAILDSQQKSVFNVE